jgi:starch phosphorylase
MKAAINGVPHLSIGDGWWAEGYNGTNGWVIDGGVGRRLERSTRRRAALYDCSRNRSCRRSTNATPRIPQPLDRVGQGAIRTVAPRFSPARMVKEYVERMYAPGLERKLEVSRSPGYEDTHEAPTATERAGPGPWRSPAHMPDIFRAGRTGGTDGD